VDDWRRTLDELAEAGLLRRPVTVGGPQGPRVRVDGRDLLCFCSNNYLGLAGHPALAEAAKAAADEYGSGAGASRLVSGTMAIHRELEEAVARFKGAEAAIVFPTGYMANVGTISTLVGKGGSVYCDRLNHASIFDGCRLSGATLRVYPHRDAGKLDELLARERKSRALVVTDTVFSMDGDLAPLPDLVEVCDRHGAMLMIDEAHATGVLGEHGRGAVEHFGLDKERQAGGQESSLLSQPREEGHPPHQENPGACPVGQTFLSALPEDLIVMGTLSKAVGSLGGFVAGSRDLIDLLVNKARSFIYTTALPPAVCAASLTGLRIIETEPERRAALWDRARQLQDGLRSLGLDVGPTETPITPLIVGESAAAVELSQELLERGILAPAIRPPTVPEGTARIRLTPMATHTPADIDTLLAALE